MKSLFLISRKLSRSFVVFCCIFIKICTVDQCILNIRIFFNEKKGKYITVGEYMSKSCLNYQDLFVSRNRILNTIDDHSVFFFYKILHFQHKWIPSNQFYRYKLTLKKAYVMTVSQNKKKPANKMCHVSVAAVQVCQKINSSWL